MPQRCVVVSKDGNGVYFIALGSLLAQRHTSLEDVAEAIRLWQGDLPQADLCIKTEVAYDIVWRVGQKPEQRLKLTSEEMAQIHAALIAILFVE